MNQIPWLHFSEAWSGASSPAESAIQALLQIEVLLTRTYMPWMPWKSQNHKTTEMLKLQLLRNTILNPFLDSEHLFLAVAYSPFSIGFLHFQFVARAAEFWYHYIDISTGGSDQYFPPFRLQSTFSDPRDLVLIQFWVLHYSGSSIISTNIVLRGTNVEENSWCILESPYGLGRDWFFFSLHVNTNSLYWSDNDLPALDGRKDRYQRLLRMRWQVFIVLSPFRIKTSWIMDLWSQYATCRCLLGREIS